MADEELRFLSALDLRARIARKKVSPVEATEAALAAMARLNPTLNIFSEVTADAARDQARAAEAAVMSGAPLGPLHGVPIHVKDLLDVQGAPTRHGSAIFADNPPATADDILVARLKKAGAILLGKTTTPEFGVKGMTDGPSFGVSRNPWDLDRTTGGSSGGAAAAAAAGLGVMGLGTDGAGSVRGPAACCGVVGLKATLGAVPYDTTRDAFGNNVFAGPLARTVADALVMHEVIEGPSAGDPWTLQRAPGAPVSAAMIGPRLDGVRLGYVRRTANPKVAADVQANTDACLKVFADRGAEVEEITEAIDWIELEGRILYQANFAVFCAPYLPKWRDRMDPVTVAFMERGAQFTLADFRNAQFARGRLFRTVQRLFERYDALLMPTHTRTALPVTFDAANDQIEIDGEKCGITRQGWTSYQYPFNLTGHPAVSIPSGFGADGLPTGFQIVGRYGAERDILRLGAVLEEDRPWGGRRPRHS